MKKITLSNLISIAQRWCRPVRWKDPCIALLLLFGLGSIPAFGQSYIYTYGGSNTKTGLHTTNNGNSDYIVFITWNYMPFGNSSVWSNPCDCSGVGLEQVQYGITENSTEDPYPSPVFSFDRNGQNLTSKSIIVGPNYNKTLHVWMKVDGQNDGGIVAGVSYDPCSGNSGGDDCNRYTNSTGAAPLTFRTAPIKNPFNLNASDDEAGGSTLKKIQLNWLSATNIPSTYVEYKIYRKPATSGSYTLVQTVPGSTLNWTDTGVLGATTYTYKVTTALNSLGMANWGPNESTGDVDNGSTLDPGFVATDGVYKNRINVKWNNLAGVVDNIKIQRSFPNSTTNFEELAILNKNATTYNDYDPIPGAKYTYRVTFLDANGNWIAAFDDLGHMKPSGVIKGRILSTGGAGVSNVLVTVTSKTAFTGTKTPAAGVNAGPYTQLTDVGGYYEIRDIYFYDDATFEIKPTRNGHTFNPDSLVRSLDLTTTIQAGINFTDLTAFTVEGEVSFKPPGDYSATGTGCKVEGAKILIDDTDFGIRTGADGTWSYALSDSNTYEFKAVYLHHTFDQNSIVLNVGADVSGINFVDQQEDSIEIRVQGGCNTSVTTTPFQPLNVKVTSVVPGRFSGTYTTNPNGYLMLPLPATEFNVNVDTAGVLPNAGAQLVDTTIRLDLSRRDSAEVIISDTSVITTPASTVVLDGDIIYILASTSTVINQDTIIQSVQPTADFIYLRDLEITIDFEQAGAEVLTTPFCPSVLNDQNSAPMILFDQGARYVLDIEVVEEGTACPVEKGTIKVYDYISDREQTPGEINITNGHAFYQVTAGLPVLAAGGNHPHQKLLYLIATAGTRPPEAEDFWGLVEGAASLTPTFVTRSPELPDLVLHDPPGDASYAMIEAGSSFRTFVNEQSEISGSGGLFSDQTFGVSIPNPLTGTATKVGINWKLEVNAGRENFDKEGYSNTITFTNAYSTSGDAIFTGNDGDVYIGKSVNEQFSIAKLLDYNTETCTDTVIDKPTLLTTGIATTFIYTEKHIRDILIPQLEYLQGVLRESAAGPDSIENIHEADEFAIDVYNWNNILLENDSNRNENATFVENLSFSAGAAVDRTEGRDTTFGGSYEYTRFVDTETAISGRFEASAGVWSDNNIGIAAKFRHSYTKDDGDETDSTRTISYHLADDDFGDFFSVDILRDNAYDVPAFRVVTGTSSCPHEPGTQPRDSADIVVLPPQLDNVPIGGQAVFTAQLVNYSNSQETREYHVRVVSNTNPDGAIIRLNGQLINHGPASFFIDAFQTATAYLTVEQGPLASNYSNIGIMMYPPCEYELWENNGAITSGDTAWITVNFETECSNVAIINPGNNWLVNQNDNDVLTVDFSGYDLNNPFLESITLQYRAAGEGWVNGPVIPKDSITQTIYRLDFDVSGLFDGAYSLRAKSACSSGRGITYSSVIDGNIDRSSIAPFGIPSPSDGFLRLGQEISITFDKNIECNLASYNTDSLSLVRADNGTAIPFTAQCSGNKIILAPVNDLFADSTLKGVELIAYVGGIEDQAGNVQEYPAKWAFQVNVSPVFWDPEVLDRAAFVGTFPVISSMLKNTASISKSFRLTSFPQWLIPNILDGTVLPNGEYIINFSVDPDLDPGIYSGTVTAMIDSLDLDLSVTFKMLAKSPNWKVDPADFDFSMTIIAQFSLDNANIQLATDTRDLISAFVNGQARGIGNIQYISDINQYAAFITVYSNDNGNSNPENVTFRFWHALKGVEYGAVESTSFVNDATLGSISAPFVLHPDGIVQEIPLKKGWNWISLNVSNSDMSRENLLESILSPEIGNDILIKRKDGKSTFYSQSAGWSGSLKILDNNQGYLIYLSGQPDTLRIVGTPVSPAPINVGQAWSWIGYQPQSVKSVNEAMFSLSPVTGDILKSQSEFAEYFDGSNNWIGNLQFMKPGMGYKLNLQTADSLTFLTYPARTGNEEYHVVHEGFESNMIVIAKVGFEGMNWVDESRFLVGAFIEGECRGTASLEYVEKLHEYRVYLPVHGNFIDQNKDIEFRVYDLNEDKEYVAEDRSEIFKVDRILGHVSNPYILFDGLVVNAGYDLEQNQPNPYLSHTLIEYLIPREEDVKLSLMDQHGREIQVLVNEVQTPGQHSYKFDGTNLPSGIYFYHLKAGEFSATRKMIKME